ncbi:MAG TPA: anhydro-N-acetylmuramic acid kinase [Chitinispirillaceae bacterium]|nr:anhydro-N-acetylmuramic acid kinase [Chitinispirillaceae bacterium]
MNPLSKLKKIKKRRALVISGSGVQNGIQCLYINFNGNFDLLANTISPYPQKVADFLELYTKQEESFKLADLAWLDYKISTLLAESAKTALMQTPTALRSPHYIILNKPAIWRGLTGENQQQSHWDLSLGDAQYIASIFNVPVLTDFARHNILAGGTGILPTNPGNQIIASRTTGISVFLNIGAICRMTIVDVTTSSLLVDSDCGPGSCLQNKFVKEHLNIKDGFDRDGSIAAEGKVEGNCLNKLSSTEWFLKPAPKNALANEFDSLLSDPALKLLSTADQAATITALSARAAYDFYRREYKLKVSPQALYISGGAVNNLTLMEYLKTYFSPIPVHNIETLGIPSDMKIPLALGITADAYISGLSIPWESGNTPKIDPLARWVLP